MYNQKRSGLQAQTFNLGYVSPLAMFTSISLLMLNFTIFKFFLLQLNVNDYNLLLTLFQIFVIIFTKNVNNNIRTFSLINVISVFFSIIIHTVLIGIFMIGILSLISFDLLGLNQSSVLYMNSLGLSTTLSTTQVEELRTDVLNAVTAKALQGVEVVSYRDLLISNIPLVSPYSHLYLYALCLEKRVDITSSALTKFSDGTYAKGSLITQLLNS